MTSICNTALQSTGVAVPDHPGYVWDEFKKTVVMSPYLVAFVVSDFEEVLSETLPNGVRWSTYARPDAIDDGLAGVAADIGPRMVEGYEAQFGVDLPLSSFGQVSLGN